MSDRYEYYDPTFYGIDFEIDPFWEQTAGGRSYLLTQVGFPSFVLEYVYLKYPKVSQIPLFWCCVCLLCLPCLRPMCFDWFWWFLKFLICTPRQYGGGGLPDLRSTIRADPWGGGGGGFQTSDSPRIGLPSPHKCALENIDAHPRFEPKSKTIFLFSLVNQSC